MSLTATSKMTWWTSLIVGVSACGAQAADDATPVADSAVTAAVEDTIGEEDTSDRVVVRNGTLIDGTGTTPVPDAVIVIEDGVIVAVGPADDIVVPSTAEVVDAGGGTILPGLVDTHVHHLNGLDLQDGKLDGISVTMTLTNPLQAGVTTYRDLGSPYGDSANIADLRAALEQHGANAPTIVMSGPLLAAEGNYAVDGFPGQALAVADGAAAADSVTRLLDAGVDQIKLMVEHWEFRSEPTPSLTAEQIKAMTDTARARGVRVVAHVSDIDEAWMALNGGADELTHWPGSEPLPDELIDELATRNVPVGTTFSILTPAAGDVRRLLDAGGTIVLSSDAPGATSTLSIGRELERMVTAGMTPMEAIVASTSHAARAVELDEQVGTLTIGKHADIIIVDGDPLDDITTIANITTVLNDGTTVHREPIE